VSLAYTGSTWTQVIVGLSIFVPVIVAGVLAWVVIRGKKDDPDEQRWKRLDEQRREAEREARRQTPH
jgi:nitrogen fixation-related uncharacterized protein